MKYETIPYVDKPVSRILFGTAQPSFLRGMENNAILDAALEAGITTFDTARNYALSEKSIGMWLRARNCRDQIVILSKCAHPDDDGTKRVSEAAIRADFARSTELLGTDYIDIYVLHRDDPDVEVAVPVETSLCHAQQENDPPLYGQTGGRGKDQKDPRGRTILSDRRQLPKCVLYHFGKQAGGSGGNLC